ncbi:MAG: T9SS type A sorting domain-containing protein [Ignavibacteria bacterium]|nr:MAG: T9SS type A sorting domain-containing protein [Ignavibacteria bacterium]
MAYTPNNLARINFTILNYQLPKQSHVTLKVHDVLGREVATLVNGVQEPGLNSVTFDGSRLSSGMYYYRLQADKYVETKKLLLLR